MKPTREIIGLRIISISDGTQVGVVKDLVLNPQEKTLDFMLVDQPTDYFGAKVIAFKDILGLGEFAITILHPGVIQDVAQNTEAQNLLKQDIRVLGTKVLTKKGQLIGEVQEILIDEETGEIAACLFKSDGQMREIGSAQVITLGKELLIVERDPSGPNPQAVEPSNEDQVQTPDVTDLIEEADPVRELEFVEEADPVRELESVEEADLVRELESVEEADPVRELEFVEEADPIRELEFVEEANLVRELELVEKTDSVREFEFVEEADSVRELNFHEEPDPVREPETSFNLFEQRQLQYFIDKMVEKDIVLDNGEVLKAGERITPNVVTHVTTRSTLMEVTSHLRKN